MMADEKSNQIPEKLSLNTCTYTVRQKYIEISVHCPVAYGSKIEASENSKQTASIYNNQVKATRNVGEAIEAEAHEHAFRNTKAKIESSEAIDEELIRLQNMAHYWEKKITEKRKLALKAQISMATKVVAELKQEHCQLVKSGLRKIRKVETQACIRKLGKVQCSYCGISWQCVERECEHPKYHIRLFIIQTNQQ